jgi:dTDP-4-dehydrorhamnose reductase
MRKRVLVIGKTGQLGLSIAKLARYYPQYEFTFVGRDVLDLSQSNNITGYFQSKKYDVIINCAAYTEVDKAESEPELANQVNHLAVRQLAVIAKEQGAVLIHISTDYVFNGQNHKPYVEMDCVYPINVYGQTKLKGEQAIVEVRPKGVIIRTSWLYSEFGDNFVKTMLRLGEERDSLNVIYDQVGSPTYAGDLAKAVVDIISCNIGLDEELLQIYHYSNEGVCSWYDFAKMIFEVRNINCKGNPIETKNYPKPAKRPHYSVLNKQKIKQCYEFEIPYWRESLRLCLKRLL